jgi:hypothetical protein
MPEPRLEGFRAGPLCVRTWERISRQSTHTVRNCVAEGAGVAAGVRAGRRPGRRHRPQCPAGRRNRPPASAGRGRTGDRDGPRSARARRPAPRQPPAPPSPARAPRTGGCPVPGPGPVPAAAPAAQPRPVAGASIARSRSPWGTRLRNRGRAELAGSGARELYGRRRLVRGGRHAGGGVTRAEGARARGRRAGGGVARAGASRGRGRDAGGGGSCARVRAVDGVMGVLSRAGTVREK